MPTMRGAAARCARSARSSFVAGLVPAIHAFASGGGDAQCTLGSTSWQTAGTLYNGVTDHPARRAWEHRAGLIDGFTKRYGLKRLVFAEHSDAMRAARQCWQNMKHWPRTWKVRLIHEQNPDWDDLYDQLA